MFYRYACPACERDLKNCIPTPKKKPWYKFYSVATAYCPYCKAEIVKRFAHFDGVMVFGLMVLMGSSGFLSIGRLTRYVLPFVVLVFVARWLVGKFLSVYISVH